VRLARYLATGFQAPATVDWTGPVNGWGMYDNDTLGDCACVAPANLIRCWTANTGAQIDLPGDAVLDAYADFGGYVTGDPSTDNGCVISDVLAGWHAQSVGIGGDVVAGFAEIDHSGPAELRQAIALFGGAIIGLSLPRAAQGRDAWIDVPAPPHALAVSSIYGGDFDLSSDWKPGSWGGHCVCVVGYDLDGFQVVTWGNELRMSNRWAAAYVDEAWAPVSADWLRSGISPTGLDLAAMQRDLAALRDAA
jgi:hypothetical protein